MSAATVRLWSRLEVVVNGQVIAAGRRLTDAPHKISLASGIVHEQTVSIAAGSSAKLFDVDDDIADFDLLWIESDQTVVLQLVTDDDADVGEELGTVTLTGSGTAGTYGPPFFLVGDDSYANFTVDFAGGTLDVIERINAKNNGSSAAQVHLLALT